MRLRMPGPAPSARLLQSLVSGAGSASADCTGCAGCVRQITRIKRSDEIRLLVSPCSSCAESQPQERGAPRGLSLLVVQPGRSPAGRPGHARHAPAPVPRADRPQVRRLGAPPDRSFARTWVRSPRRTFLGRGAHADWARSLPRAVRDRPPDPAGAGRRRGAATVRRVDASGRTQPDRRRGRFSDRQAVPASRRDPLFTDEFRGVLAAAGVKCLRLPARSPDLNSIAERFVLSISPSALSKLGAAGENHLRRAVSEYMEHDHRERNHQGVGNRLLSPGEQAVRPANGNVDPTVKFRRILTPSTPLRDAVWSWRLRRRARRKTSAILPCATETACRPLALCCTSYSTARPSPWSSRGRATRARARASRTAPRQVASPAGRRCALALHPPASEDS